VDLLNRSNFGSSHADGRCVNASINPASSSGWVTEIASLHKAHLLNQAYALTKTPSQCKGCAEALGHALPPTCMRDVVAMNVLTTEVRCLCLERSLESRLTQRRHTAVSLLVIDTEGYGLTLTTTPTLTCS